MNDVVRSAILSRGASCGRGRAALSILRIVSHPCRKVAEGFLPVGS